MTGTAVKNAQGGQGKASGSLEQRGKRRRPGTTERAVVWSGGEGGGQGNKRDRKTDSRGRQGHRGEIQFLSSVHVMFPYTDKMTDSEKPHRYFTPLHTQNTAHLQPLRQITHLELSCLSHQYNLEFETPPGGGLAYTWSSPVFFGMTVQQLVNLSCYSHMQIYTHTCINIYSLDSTLPLDFISIF